MYEVREYVRNGIVYGTVRAYVNVMKTVSGDVCTRCTYLYLFYNVESRERTSVSIKLGVFSKRKRIFGGFSR